MARRMAILAGLAVLGAWAAGCEDGAGNVGDPGGVIDVVDVDDADVPEPGDDGVGDAGRDGVADDGAGPACAPETLPTCLVDDVAVSCDIVIAELLGGWDSPRGWCETACADGGAALNVLSGPFCPTTLDVCLETRDLSCEDCCLLPWTLPNDRLDDGDWCTVDACAGDACTHVPVDWIGQACANENDFGTCAGVYTCGQGCGAADPRCQLGARQCTATVATREIPDGVDNDCDGVVDEAPTDAVYRLTGPDGVVGPAIVALDDGRFVVAWRVAQEVAVPGTTSQGRVQRLFVQVGTRQDPTGGLPIAVGGDWVEEVRLFPLPQGRFALVWMDTDAAGESRVVRVRVMRSPAEPPLADDTLPWSASLQSAFAWPDGSFAVPAYAGKEGVEPPFQWMQRFDADGRRAGTFEIASLWDGHEGGTGPDTVLAGDAAGRIVAAWHAPTLADATRTGFWARWFDGDGAPLTDAFELTTEAYRFQAERGGPYLAPLADGRMVAGWSMRPVVAQGGRIRVRVLAGGALPVDDPIPLGAVPDGGRQVLAGLAVHGDEVVATWLGTEAGLSAEGVYVTRIGLPALDAPSSQPIRASSPGYMGQVTGTLLPDGTPIAAWQWRPYGTGGYVVSELRVGFPSD